MHYVIHLNTSEIIDGEALRGGRCSLTPLAVATHVSIKVLSLQVTDGIY